LNAPTGGGEVEEEAGVAEDLKLLADFVADVPIAGMQFLKSRGQGVRILVGEFGFAGEHTRPRVSRPAPPPVEPGRNGSRDGGHAQGWVRSAGAPTTAREARALPKSGNGPKTGLEVEEEAGVAENL